MIHRYFAYGSNMLLARLRQPDRAPGAQLVGPAFLADHQLTFDKVGRDGSGKCTVEGQVGERVWGGVFTVDANEVSGLDRAEGLGIGYRRRQALVRTPVGETLDVFYYEALRVQRGLAPFDWYLDLVVAGALELELPDEYVTRLRDLPATSDTDTQRAERERRALAPA